MGGMSTLRLELEVMSKEATLRTVAECVRCKTGRLDFVVLSLQSRWTSTLCQSVVCLKEDRVSN